MSFAKSTERVNAAGPRLSAVRYVPWIWGMGIALILTGRMVLGGFCIVDDHYEALWLTGGFPFSKLWPALLATEVGHLGSGDRFRPVYLFYLELEAWIFGNHPGIYHALRVLYFGIFLGAGCRVATRCVGLLPALALVVGISGVGIWDNLWTLSFGPAEQVAIIGISLLLIACETIVSRFVADERIPSWALPMASLGTAIAAGSKENFIFVVVNLGAAATITVVNQRVRAVSAALSLAPLIVPALVLYALASAALKTRDFYGADNSIAHRLAETFGFHQMVARPLFVPFAIAAVLVAPAFVWMTYRRSLLPRPQLRRAIVVFLGQISILAFYIIWEIFFYDGRLPSRIRYDFPILLLPPSIALGFAAYLRYTSFVDKGWGWRSAQIAFMAFVGFYLAYFELPFSLPRAVERSIARTRAFDRDFNALRLTTSRHPDWPVVLEPNSPWDYEVVDTFRIWASFFGVASPLMLRVEIGSRNPTQFEQSLTDQMRRWGSSGESGRFQPLPNPSALTERDGHCFAIGFWKPIVSPCVALDFVPSRYIPRS